MKNNHKNWPYWVKGGIIGLATLVVIVVAFLFQAGELSLFAYIFTIMSYIPERLITLTHCKIQGSDVLECLPTNALIGVSFYLIEFFACGVILGWLYGKVKESRQNKVTTEN
ncbi:MAG: hypothetical protein Q7R79_04515 [bacterium]|nr:hypothetical protein [bacterium]